MINKNKMKSHIHHDTTNVTPLNSDACMCNKHLSWFTKVNGMEGRPVVMSGLLNVFSVYF